MNQNKKVESSPFRRQLIDEFICAMNATLGDAADRYDEQMKKDPNLKVKDLLDPAELLEMARKAEWYIFDGALIAKMIKDNKEFKELKEKNKSLNIRGR